MSHRQKKLTNLVFEKLCFIAKNATTFIVTARANPTIVSYNASAVKIYSATSILVRFEKNVLKNALAYHNAGVVCNCR
jgi:hypothetical protein